MSYMQNQYIMEFSSEELENIINRIVTSIEDATL
jgi:hypothetical protein